MTQTVPSALILTAGFGRRLRPLTDSKAKPSVPVAGVPLIVRILEWLASQGIETAVLNLHYKPDSITTCVGHGRSIGIKVKYSWEPRLLGSGGGPRSALSILGDEFFVINGDTLINIDLSNMVQAHREHNAVVSLAVSDNLAPQQYGGVKVGEDSFVQGFNPPGNHKGLHFVGIQLAKASVFSPLRYQEPASSIGGIYDSLLQSDAQKIYAHRVSEEFRDIGTPSDYFASSLAVAEIEGRSDVLTGNNCQIHPTASLTRTIVWDDVIIEEGCRIKNSILSDGVRLLKNTICENKIVSIDLDSRMKTDPESQHLKFETLNK